MSQLTFTTVSPSVDITMFSNECCVKSTTGDLSDYDINVNHEWNCRVLFLIPLELASELSMIASTPRRDKSTSVCSCSSASSFLTTRRQTSNLCEGIEN